MSVYKVKGCYRWGKSGKVYPTKPEAFQEYFDFCEECKDEAKCQLGLVE